MKRRFAPRQDYTPLLSPEQLAATITDAKRRAMLYARGMERNASDNATPPAVRRTIEHTDAEGFIWRFGLICTDEQAQRFRNFLAAICTVGKQRGKRQDEQQFYRGLEYAVLSALAEQYPAQAAPPEPAQGVEQEPATR